MMMITYQKKIDDLKKEYEMEEEKSKEEDE